jgi:hypothetical protein
MYEFDSRGFCPSSTGLQVNARMGSATLFCLCVVVVVWSGLAFPWWLFLFNSISKFTYVVIVRLAEI